MNEQPKSVNVSFPIPDNMSDEKVIELVREVGLAFHRELQKAGIEVDMSVEISGVLDQPGEAGEANE